MKTCLNSLYFIAFEAPCADVIIDLFTVFFISYLLNVCLKRSLRLAVGVGHVVARYLTFPAYAAYSRHIVHLRTDIILIRRETTRCAIQRQYNIISGKKKQLKRRV